jgi:hypothetical protein
MSDLSAQQFNRLLALDYHRLTKKWRCRCSCGNEVLVHGYNLKRGNSKSCGCLRREAARKTGAITGKVNGVALGRKWGPLNVKRLNRHNTTHGLFTHPLYGIWDNMMDRCYKPQYGNSKNYVGIEVWEPWHDIRAFIFGLTALLGERPGGMTLDRINSHDGYYPWNVRWANRNTQKLNHRDNTIPYFSQAGDH